MACGGQNRHHETVVIFQHDRLGDAVATNVGHFGGLHAVVRMWMHKDIVLDAVLLQVILELACDCHGNSPRSWVSKELTARLLGVEPQSGATSRLCCGGFLT